MKIQEIQQKSRDEVYDLFSKERINADSPVETDSRLFPIGSRAYKWTNEALVTLRDELHLDLEGKDMLMVSASGDPFATFADLGVGRQVGFDTAHKAVLWNEVKLEAIQKLDHKDFRRFTGLEAEDEGKKKNYWEIISQGLSQYAQDVIGTLFSRHGTLQGIVEGCKLFRGTGCTGYFPNSNIYSVSERDYETARKHLKDNPPVLIPADLGTVLTTIEDKFGAFYASNILDHFRNDEGRLDYSEKIIGGFLDTVNNSLEDRATMVFQFEWSELAKANAKKVLNKMGYDFNIADNSPKRGYGNLAVARRK